MYLIDDIFTYQLNNTAMTNLIPATIEYRAEQLILNGVDPIEAVKQAILDEMDLIGSLITSSNKMSKRGRIASDYLRKRYNEGNKARI